MQSFSQGACARDRKLKFNLATNRSPRKGDVESCETGKIKEGKREGEPKSGEERKKKKTMREKKGDRCGCWRDGERPRVRLKGVHRARNRLGAGWVRDRERQRDRETGHCRRGEWERETGHCRGGGWERETGRDKGTWDRETGHCRRGGWEREIGHCRRGDGKGRGRKGPRLRGKYRWSGEGRGISREEG